MNSNNQQSVIFSSCTAAPHLRHRELLDVPCYPSYVSSLQWGQTATVTHLFSLQCQLYEDLLQLLVDVVDTELLEAVPREDLESVDIQNTNVDICQTHCHRIVDSLK